jgi:hypothetical protein
MHRQRDFVLLVTLVAAAVPSYGQAIEQASSRTQGAASIPDFSGIWTRPYLGIESPRSGPGPVTNRSRRNGVRDFYQYVGDYTNPILKPQAAEIVKKFGEISLTGALFPSPRNQCWPQGVPGVFFDIAMQMVQQSEKITIIYSSDHEVRRVRMNQPHSVPVIPSWYGDSVGHYEGDTLVIDTVGVKIGPFAMIDFYGTPHTAALHVVERYRLIDYEAAREAQEWGLKENPFLPHGGDHGLPIDPSYKGKGLQVQFTVEDEGVFKMPWSASVTYRHPLGEWPEIVCAENLRATYITRDSDVPRADKPDF